MAKQNFKKVNSNDSSSKMTSKTVNTNKSKQYSEYKASNHQENDNYHKTHIDKELDYEQVDESFEEGNFDINFNLRKIMAMLPFFIALIIFIWIWITPEKPVIDPWFKAMNTIQSSFDIKDNIQKQKMIDSGGKVLVECANKYGHARVHYLCGIYYAIINQLDSAIAQQELAIQKGSGALVNQVDITAKDELVRLIQAKSSQFLQTREFDKARQILAKGYEYAPKNAELNFSMAITFHNQNILDSALHYYNIALANNPRNPADIFSNVGHILLQKNQLVEAKNYFDKSLQINPQNQVAINGLNMIKQRGL